MQGALKLVWVKRNGGFYVPGLLIFPLVVYFSLKSKELLCNYFTIYKCKPGGSKVNRDLRCRPSGPSFHQHKIKIHSHLIILVQKTVPAGFPLVQQEKALDCALQSQDFIVLQLPYLSFLPPTLAGGHKSYLEYVLFNFSHGLFFSPGFPIHQTPKLIPWGERGTSAIPEMLETESTRKPTAPV